MWRLHLSLAIYQLVTSKVCERYWRVRVLFNLLWPPGQKFGDGFNMAFHPTVKLGLAAYLPAWLVDYGVDRLIPCR